mmetsp:Transcript_452/g.636  ORF Transcript_452/g.636 Transcript_452/m.636 type:complete len:209 (-) Transcript_452:95-721(-)|eukprot:CAMPEP_0196581296 /NCGR_PEP_ID=MMETSP1081-20130531/33485_1 /TAXON_ID=36882 /ORGANISM="Pyramimonas amylifera, Strain CCMP720" /LENGTH=208 /DNA_ID=CAMNT_0041901481 /DNA_START=316 /DNA_END=942 /DNA_ORIENTATION=+
MVEAKQVLFSTNRMNLNNTSSKIISSEVKLVARRYAIKTNPPTVVLEYFDSTKTRLRTVKLLELNANSDVDQVTSKVIHSFPRKLDPSTVNREQVRRLVLRLQQKTTELSSDGDAKSEMEQAEEGGLQAGETEVDLNDPNLDLNKVSMDALKAAKKKMDETFVKHQKLPGENGFQYDVQVDFQFAEGSGDWDDSDLDIMSDPDPYGFP